MNKKEIKIAVIGGSGFIGLELVRELPKTKFKFILINRNSIAVNLIENSNEYLVEMIKLLEGVNIVVHLASSSNPFGSEINPYLELENLRLIFCLLKACEVLGISKIIYSSSGGVVYSDTGNIHNEQEIASPTCSYGVGKVASENYLRIHALRTKSDIAILRISNPYCGSQVLKNSRGIVPYIYNCIN